jgi:hypothetical protein
MYVTRLMWVIAVAGFAVTAGANGAFAQSVPAEIPSASFRGDQYVDSRGCAYVRVGVGPATQWVPRVGSNRRPICGLTPSGAGHAPNVAASAAPNRQQPGVTVIGGTPPPVAATAPVQPAARDVATQARPPAAVPRSVATTPRVGASAPQPQPQPQRPAAAGACPNLPAEIRSYFEGDNARCGPQAVHPGDAVRGPDRRSALGQSGAIPAPAPALRQVVRYDVNPPAGYRAAWQDDRLNPYRGLGSAQGQRQMETVWTNTTPRRLAGEAPRGLRAVVARAARPATLVPAQLVILRP